MTLRLSLLVALAPLALAGSARAQTVPGPVGALAHTAEEAEALQTLEDGRLVSARTQAEEVLRRDPQSIVGHYVLARAYFDAEGSLARALYHFGRARELYEGGAQMNPDFHQELLYQNARLAGQMELYEFQLDLLGYHDHLYDPDLIAERCWPLMKLGRMDEARRFAETAAASPDSWQRSAGLNALCAVEGEARTRTAYRTACINALESARQEVADRQTGDVGAGLTVDAYNAALASASALSIEEAITLAEEGARRFEPTVANPWSLVMELQLSDGRTGEALDSFVQMLAWNDRIPASLRDQGRADLEAQVAMLLLIAGETEQAETRIDRALDRPDRRGLTTDGAEQARGRHALLRRMVERARIEERRERASFLGRGAQLSEWVSGLWDRWFGGFTDDERLVAVLSDSGRLQDTLRPYMAGGIDGLSPWMVGELIDVVGPGVFAVALERAETADREEAAATPYYQALDAELAGRRGDTSRALRVGEEALTALEGQRGTAMVRARLAGVLAEAAEDDGRTQRANELYQLAMDVDPSVIRRLGLSLPVRFTASGADAEEAADWLSRSPRFHEERGYFELRIESVRGGMRACLASAAGNEIRCVTAAPPAEPTTPPPTPPSSEGEEDEDVEEPPEDPNADLTLPQRLAMEVHRQLFAARIELGAIDLRSLDGRTTGGSALANDRLRELTQ